MVCYVRTLFGFLIAFLLVAGPYGYYSYYHTRLRNVHVVRDGVLYRSGQLTLDGLRQLIRDYGIRTVITCRDAHHPDEAPPDKDEENYCRTQCLNYHRLPPGPWVEANGSVPADEDMRQFRAVMNNPANYPVLVHCFAGKHRTGAYCAVYRMEYEHWSKEKAIKEMMAHGYDNISDHQDLLGYLEQYRPTWLQPANEQQQ